MAADNEPAEAALRVEHAARRRRPSWPRACRSRAAPGAGPARGAGARRPVRRVRLAASGSAGSFMPQSRAAMTVARLLGAAARRARARPVRRARRQDDAPRRADGGTRRARRRRAPSRPRRRAARARPRAWAPRVEVRTGDAAAPHEPGAYDRVLVDPPCSDLGTLASRPDARWRKPPDLPRAARARAGARSCAPAPARCARAARSSTRPARSRPPRTRPWCEAFLAERAGLHGRRPALRRAAVGACRACPASRRRSRTATGPRASSSPACAARSARERRRAVDLGDVCPACHEPWLRPTNLPGRYRCVNCLRRFELRLRVPELRRALDDRAHVEHRALHLQPLPELDAPADLMAGAPRGRRAVDPGGRLRPPRRAGRRGARRGRAHDPRRRHGRPLRPAAQHGPGGRRRRSPTRSTTRAATSTST